MTIPHSAQLCGTDNTFTFRKHPNDERVVFCATIAGVRAAYASRVAATGNTSAHVREQFGYDFALILARENMSEAKGWKEAILFDLLCEVLPAEYRQAIRDLAVIMDNDASGTEGEALYAADQLLEFARDKYAVAEGAL